MKRNGIEALKLVGALRLELLVPGETVRRRGGRGTHDVPALVSEGLDVLAHERAGVLGRHVGLTLLVHLVHGHDGLVLVPLAVLVVEDALLEVGKVGACARVTPEHGNEERVGGGTVPLGPGTPRVEPRDAAGEERCDFNAAGVGPAKTSFALVAVGLLARSVGRRRRRGGRGRGSRRRTRLGGLGTDLGGALGGALGRALLGLVLLVLGRASLAAASLLEASGTVAESDTADVLRRSGDERGAGHKGGSNERRGEELHCDGVVGRRRCKMGKGSRRRLS